MKTHAAFLFKSRGMDVLPPAPPVIALPDRLPPPPPPVPIASAPLPPSTLALPPLTPLHYRSTPLGPHFRELCSPIVYSYSALPLLLDSSRWVHYPVGLNPGPRNMFRGVHLREPLLWAWPPLEAVEPTWPWSEWNDADQLSANFLPVPSWVRDEVEFGAQLERDFLRRRRRAERGMGRDLPIGGPLRAPPPPPWPRLPAALLDRARGTDVVDGGLREALREQLYLDRLDAFNRQRSFNAGSSGSGARGSNE
jgi:hypothetical protein